MVPTATQLAAMQLTATRLTVGNDTYSDITDSKMSKFLIAGHKSILTVLRV